MDADTRLEEPPLAPGACCDTAPCTCQEQSVEFHLEEIRAREAAATRGPWRVESDRLSLTRWVVSENEMLGANLGYLGNCNQADAAFIAHGRADIPWLVAELTEALAKLGIAERRVEELATENEAYEWALGLNEAA